MGPQMSCEVTFPFEGLIALVTLERFLSCMLPHVNFQVTPCDAGIPARWAPVQLFTRVCFLVCV